MEPYLIIAIVIFVHAAVMGNLARLFLRRVADRDKAQDAYALMVFKQNEEIIRVLRSMQTPAQKMSESFREYMKS